jgi:hypothetical protein
MRPYLKNKLKQKEQIIAQVVELFPNKFNRVQTPVPKYEGTYMCERQKDCEFKATLGYIVNSRPA